MNSIFRHVTWRAVFISGVVAGTLFLLVNIILTPSVLQVEAGLTLRYFAALVMGSGVLTQSQPEIMIVGVIVHYVLSLAFALLIAIVVHRWGLLVGIIGGALLGLAIYSINLYTLTTFFQWFFAINSTIIIVSHVIFGAVAGGIYELFDHYDQPIAKAGGI